MYFKPRIFISSTMGDKLQLRKKIKTSLQSCGAEVALYEKDLTPSINPMTYRDDILQTDFVIFIIDERYGNPTSTGLSGTEEEFNIVAYAKKPCHIYLKQIEKTDNAKRFEDLITSKGFSVYYYKNEKELLKKIRSTSFTIARDIVNTNIDNLQITPIRVYKLALKHDIEVGKSYCKILERVYEISSQTQFDIIQSNIMIQAIDMPVHFVLSSIKSSFIDKKADELLKNLCNEISIFNQRMATESVLGSISTTFNFPYGDIIVSMNQWTKTIDLNWYKTQATNISNAYLLYKSYIQNMAFEIELLDE